MKASFVVFNFFVFLPLCRDSRHNRFTFSIFCGKIEQMSVDFEAKKTRKARKAPISEAKKSNKNAKTTNEAFTGNNAHKKKIIYVATVDSHIELFHLPYLKMLKEKGFEVHVATNTDKPIQYCDKKIQIPIEKNPFKLSNLRAIKQLQKIIEAERYNIIHCHTPMGSVVARLAAKKARKNGTRVIYTAHGFHFYKGAPLHYWLMFYPAEKYLAKYTDTLILINQEDYDRAKRKFGKRCHDIQYIPGIGVDPERFKHRLTQAEKSSLRKSLGLKDDDFVLIFPAELSRRKNQTWLIKTLKPLFVKNKNLHLLLPGKDSLNGECHNLVKKLDLQLQVHLLGFRNDIPELLQISNVLVSSSRQEGLPVNILEGLFLNLLVVAIRCRGVEDSLKNDAGAFLIEKWDKQAFLDAIGNVASIKNSHPRNIQVESYSLPNIRTQYESIYDGRI